MTEKYETVNGAWPKGPLPTLTDQEAIDAVKRLYRFAMKKPLRMECKIGTGNRHTWPRNGVYVVNASRGWHDLVHSVSHYCHRRLFPNKKPHDGTGTHAFLERELIQHVVKAKWLEGSLRKNLEVLATIEAGEAVQSQPVAKVKPAKRDIQTAKLQKILDRIKRWEQKERRAQTALAKLSKQRRYYERSLAA